ncbi:SGNH/GDSL hydrolase family protein [Sphingomonas sanguinis]|uniref:SGNH/GDSL hydrolase family protein n=1 Tax=Sphingomonas sp. LC-1 TaxID=3110957 RepID=UPI0021BB512F|nr:SGNH/GDSL hydrolase family protein [Sphingomonas sp. LC-1]MCT8000450.1 SGNH/GDSL hydrolase family protein [Sphingomonas sp. LC-1]
MNKARAFHRAAGRLTGLIALSLTLAAAAPAREVRWTPGWGSSQMRLDGPNVEKLARTGPATIRQIVRLTADGRTVRLRLSNIAGQVPMTIGAATIGLAQPGQSRVAAPQPVLFDGARDAVVPPGAEIYSDPIALPVARGADVAVSLYFPQAVTTPTGHSGARSTTYLVAGDATGRESLPEAQKIGGWWSLSDIEVRDAAQTATIVTIGDSITDGYGIVDDSNTRWPDELAKRLAASPATRGFSIVNAGIGGNRVLLDGLGPSLMARFDRDVIARPGVTHALVLEGVNDLGVLTREHPVDAATHQAIVRQISFAYRQLAERAHAHGIRLIVGTITPFQGNDYYHPGPETEADRQAINRFIRTSGLFDGVVDFDKALADPAQPARLLPAYDCGDHLHPSAAGYRVMAQAVPLALFGKAPPRR